MKIEVAEAVAAAVISSSPHAFSSSGSLMWFSIGGDMSKTPEKEIEMEPDAMERMNRALREAMKAPPRPHKDEPKRRKKRTYTSKAKRDG